MPLKSAMKPQEISASEFVRNAATMMHLVEKEHKTLLIKRFGKPAVQIVPVKMVVPKEERHSNFGCMKGTAECQAENLFSTGEIWYAEHP